MKSKYIKSPLNYMGGKYKLLDQIIPLFPDNVNTFVDLFAGGFNVGANVKCNKVIYNDINKPLTNLMCYIYNHDTDEMLKNIDRIINYYGLSKTNKQGYHKLRDYYNSRYQYPLVLYVLICYSFNNIMRFNKLMRFNAPFAGDRCFNSAMLDNFKQFAELIKTKYCVFYNVPFNMVQSICKINPSDFVYCDPPYLGSDAVYNENKSFSGWDEWNEVDLLCLLDELNNKGIKFALSNNLKYENKLLKKWIKKYNIHYLIADYSNCSSNKIDKSKDREILVCNY